MRSLFVHVATKCRPSFSNSPISSGFTSKRWRWRSVISVPHMPHTPLPFFFPYNLYIIDESK